MTPLAFVLAAGCGGLLRWWALRVDRTGRHLGTFAVNVLASFVAGLAAGLDDPLRTIVSVAFLGALSTFSTVVAQVVEDLRRARRRDAAIYLGASLVAGVGAAWLGLRIG